MSTDKKEKQKGWPHKDVHDWKVVTNEGKLLALRAKNADGQTVWITRFDGFRKANEAAKKLDGYAVRV